MLRLMAMAAPIYGLEDFVRLFDEDVDYFPFYSVILYTPQNGLDQRLHEYVSGHWNFLNRLTGESSLLAALESRDHERSIDDFKPEEVYDIARELGVPVNAMPALVFFASARDRDETLVLKLGEFLSSSVTDEELTDFFRGLSAVVDVCAARDEGDRLECLRRGIEREWPKDSQWHGRARDIADSLVSSTTKAASVVQALSVIAALIGRLT
jgi:hypothetical protein